MNTELVAERLKECLKSVDSREKTIILDGKYMLYKSRTVYVNVNENKDLIFYIQQKQDDGKTKRELITDKALDMIADRMASQTLGKFYYDGVVPWHRSLISVDGELDFLIIESTLYNIARMYVTSNNNTTQRLREINKADFKMSSEQLTRLATAFKEESFLNYYKFAFSKNQRRIVNRCYRHKFFKIMHLFIPVAIKYDYIYNPLMDDPSDQIFMQSKLITDAVAKGRCFTLGNHFTYYLLTHEEICKALGLSRFMRFTPDFLYKYVVGLLYPGNKDFPSKTREVFARTLDSEVLANYKPHYAKEEYQELLISLYNKLEKCTDDEVKQQLNKEYAILSSYVKIDSLYYELDKDRRALLNIGTPSLDKPIKTELLYEILMEGKILFDTK